MRRRLCAAFLAACSLWGAAPGLAAEEPQPQKKPPAQKAAISSEDRKVIKNMELLALLDLLKDMELLEAETKAVPEEKK